MNATASSILVVLGAYLIGAIPFGYLTAKMLKGIDIRTVGSGNIGATNVGRVLGFRFFVLVFLFDLAKGWLPTWGAPRLVTALSGSPAIPDLAVLAGLASVLGHNFPVYLRFRGGKGVAASLGAVLALEPLASVAAGFGFLAALVACRYVSLSALIGAGVFAAVYFARVDGAWSREHAAMSALTVGLVVLMVVRHRKNLERIRQGTEPRVNLRRRDRSRSGKIAAGWLVVLAVAAVGLVALTASAVKTLRPGPLRVGRYEFREVARAGTGHQRAERVAFADGGRVLATTCPRYHRLVIYRVNGGDALEPCADVDLGGKPVAVCPTEDRLWVLCRPPGDQSHVEPGWLQPFDFEGNPIGARTPVGFYPDDLALTPDGRHALVLTSGRAEGSADRPAPALDVLELSDGKSVGRVTFDGRGDDPSRLTLSLTGRGAAVTLSGAEEVAAVDLSEATRPVLIGRSRLAKAEHPYPSRSSDDTILMPVAGGAEGVVLPLAGLGDCVASTLPHGSGLALVQAASQRTVGRLTLRSGSLGLSNIRPTGLAYSPERGLIAVANRSGGVHLVAVRAGGEAVALRPVR